MGYPFWQVYDPASANFNPAPLSKKAITSFEKKEELVLVPMDMERRTRIWCLRASDYRQRSTSLFTTEHDGSNIPSGKVKVFASFGEYKEWLRLGLHRILSRT